MKSLSSTQDNKLLQPAVGARPSGRYISLTASITARIIVPPRSLAPASAACGGISSVGAWRSLVAHLLWEQRVGGSNPSAPTNFTAPRFDHAACNGLLAQRWSGFLQTKIDQVVDFCDANTHDAVRAAPVYFDGTVVLGDSTAGEHYIVHVPGQLPRIFR